MFTNMETSTPITVPKKKFPFLKRGTAARRLKERSLSNTSRQAPEMRQPLGPISTHTSNQSLPIIENLSPIPHQPPVSLVPRKSFCFVKFIQALA